MGESNVKVSGRDYSALAFRIKGEAKIEVHDRQYNIGANDILYMPQNVSYTAKYSDTEILVIHFKTACDDRFAKVYSANNSERMYRDFLKMHILWERKEPGYQWEILSVLYGVLAEISRENSEMVLRADFLKGISFMNENFRNSTLSVPQVCREAGICETSFRKFMKVYCGKTPVEYLTELRLEYARNLIVGGASVKQSSLESGFNDPKYFSRIVKKYFGCRATELKNFGK